MTEKNANPHRNPEYDLCKFYFTNRVVNTWNYVISYVVSANMLNCFRSRCDK